MFSKKNSWKVAGLAAVLAGIAAVMTIPALVSAGKPVSGTVSVADGVYSGTTTATVGGDATAFESSSGVWVSAHCYQGEVLVYGQMVKADASGSAVLTLGPTQMWTGGGAECTAEAGTWTRTYRWRPFAETTFSVAP